MVCLRSLLLLLIFWLCQPTQAAVTRISEASAREVIQNGKVIFTNVLYRHGDRTPMSLCPNDPLASESAWSREWGQLTGLGSQQHYKLGKLLRQRYGSILSTTYKPSEIYIRSTNIDRALASAMSNLAGLYPPKLVDRVSNDINWQPIPVHTEPENADYLMGLAPCNAFDTLYEEYLTSQGITDAIQPYYARLTEKCGAPVQSFESFTNTYDGWKVEEAAKRPVPSLAKGLYANPVLEDLYYFGMGSFGATEGMARLKAGPLIKEMLTNMQAKAKKQLQPDRSMFMYSAHDVTITTLLGGLGMFDKTSPAYPRPGYAAVLLMDLIVDEYDFKYVSMTFKNGTNYDPVLLAIPDCGTVCPLKDMIKMYENIFPGDIVAECKN